MAGIRRGQGCKIVLGALLLAILLYSPVGAQRDTASRDQFAGIGVELTIEEGLVKIVRSLDSTPASRAGIVPGDFITELVGKSVRGLTLSQAAEMIRGPANGTIELTIIHKGQDRPIKITLVRPHCAVSALT
jgi:carboxyl-terminal processing protease